MKQLILAGFILASTSMITHAQDDLLHHSASCEAVHMVVSTYDKGKLDDVMRDVSKSTEEGSNISIDGYALMLGYQDLVRIDEENTELLDKAGREVIFPKLLQETGLSETDLQQEGATLVNNTVHMIYGMVEVDPKVVMADVFAADGECRLWLKKQLG